MPTKGGTKVGVGTRFRSIYADSNALWEVKKSRGRDTWDCEIVNEPIEIGGKTYDGDYAGVRKVFGGEEIRRSIGFSEVWKSLGDKSDKFFDGLVPGDVVHYHNSFGQYVRCEVTPERELRPVALIGPWRDIDLPRRHADGTVYEPYHVQKIREGRAWRPSSSTVFEAPDFVPPRGEYADFDPRSAKPISLDVPPMTDREIIKASQWRMIARVQAVLSGEGEEEQRDPADRLARAKSMLEDFDV